MHRLTFRLLRWLDPIFALTLTAALVMVAVTAWPRSAAAADLATEHRSVPAFEAVQTQGPNVRLQQGDGASVSVAADASLLPLLETVVEDTRLGKTLVVRWKRGSGGGHWDWAQRQTPLVTVVAPRVTGLLVSGAGDILAEGLRPPALAARIEGSGDIQLTDLATDALTLAVAGSGDIRASGRSSQLSVSVAGSGQVRAGDLVAGAVQVRIAGSGDVQVHAEQALAVRIAGSGDVVYSGNPALQQSIQGSGSVTRR
jgi:hypothetical protein